jgi:poly-beta-1,6-N-acetyl-D-glucosamine biosynthesis protein PgaD
MNAPHIIDARDSLRWHQRLISDASTVLLWGVWLNLWLPVVRTLHLPAFGHAARRAAVVALGSGHHAAMPRYVAALAGTSGSLWLWNRLPAFQPRSPSVGPVAVEAGEPFAPPLEAILAGKGASICVVHHDEAGRLVRVEPQQG